MCLIKLLLIKDVYHLKIMVKLNVCIYVKWLYKTAGVLHIGFWKDATEMDEGLGW